MKKYDDAIQTINLGLAEFSTFLSNEHKIKPLTDNLADTKSYLNLTELSWEEGQFPNISVAGVYFMFARKEKDENSLAIYVGKASHNSYIGNRA